MSAPPLPERFGNYALGEFAEVVAPAPISWLPQTGGWLAVALILLAMTLYKGWKWLQHWHRNRYRGEALALLAALAREQESTTIVTDINQVMKRTALAAFPREQVAHLSGREWVSFLNKQCAQPALEARTQTLLAEGSYRTAAIDKVSLEQLAANCTSWVRLHVNRYDV